MNHARFACLALAVSLAQGCATITSTELQPLSLTTETADGARVENASCTLRNDKGSWTAESPRLVPVHRSGEDLLVECKSCRSRWVHRSWSTGAMSRMPRQGPMPAQQV
jgi:hypothetical protein